VIIAFHGEDRSFTWLEDLITFVATRGELLIVTFAAVELIILATEGFVDQRCFAHRAEETFLVPMSIFVGKILGVRADLLSAFFTRIGESIFVTFNTIGMFIFHDVSRSGQISIAVGTNEMLLTRSSRGMTVVLIRRMARVDPRRMIQRTTIAIIDLDNDRDEVLRRLAALTYSSSSMRVAQLVLLSRGTKQTNVGRRRRGKE
jgi:hypothetical protein